MNSKFRTKPKFKVKISNGLGFEFLNLFGAWVLVLGIYM
jgi:hypothetical protein